MPVAGGPRLWLARLGGGRRGGAGRAPRAGTGGPIRYGYLDGAGRSRPTRRSSRCTPGAPRCRAPGGPFTARAGHRAGGAAACSSPRSRCTPASPRPSATSALPRALRGAARPPPASSNAARGRGGRVVAVGTTVVRALETVADADGTCARGAGWTDLVITPERGLRAVDGLLTGWHEPEASHLSLLEAAAGPELLRPLLPRGGRARLPLARVRRQPPRAAVTAGGPPRTPTVRAMGILDALLGKRKLKAAAPTASSR